MGWQWNIYLGRLRTILITSHTGASSRSARVTTASRPARAKRRKAVDAPENAADLFGAEEAVLHRQAGGAEAEASFEQGEVGGQGCNVCKGESVRQLAKQ